MTVLIDNVAGPQHPDPADLSFCSRRDNRIWFMKTEYRPKVERGAAAKIAL